MHLRVRSQSGLSLVEMMVSLGIAGIVFGGAMKLVSSLMVQKEFVDSRIDLDSMRWYVRDALDCKRTLGIDASTKLPLSCANYPPEKNLSLRATALSGSGNGTEINRVFENTRWKFRAFCQNDGLVVQYAPRKFKATDAGLEKPPSAPVDVLLPRQLRPLDVVAAPVVPFQVGFAPVGNQFSGEKPVECPPTNSLGSLIALGRFAAQTVLNTARVDDGMGKFKDQLKNQSAISQAGVAGGLDNLARDVGTGNAALQGTIADTRAFANKWMQDLAVKAIRKGGEAVAKQVVSGVMGGKGVDTKGILEGFTRGTLDSVAKDIGAPPIGSNVVDALRNGKVGMSEILDGAPVLDSGLDVFAQIPLKMAVAATDVQKSIDQRMTETTNVLWQGVGKALPNNQIAQMAAKAAWDTEKFLREDAVGQFSKIIDQTVGDPLKRAVGGEVDQLKKALDGKFAEMEANAKRDPSTMGQVLAKIAERKGDVLRQVDGLKGQLNKQVDNMLAVAKSDFARQMGALAGNGPNGVRAVLDQFLKDVQKTKEAPRTAFQDALNKVRFDPSIAPQVGVQGNPFLPDPGWRDLFDGAGLLCRDEFSANPVRDFAPESNPCPFVNGGKYPFFAGRRSGEPSCCREVESPDGNAQCEAHEYAVFGGAECSGTGLPLSGVNVSRTDVKPVFDGQGFGIAAPFTVSPSYGGIVPPGDPSPKPHQHVVQGGAPVIVLPVGPGALTVRDPFYSSIVWLGGFLRGSAAQYASGGKPNGQAAACVFANMHKTRHGDWTGGGALHKPRTKTLCCPLLGVQ